MNVCSLELSKQLYEVSGWNSTAYWHRNDYPNNPDKYPDEWYLESQYPYTTNPPDAEKFEAGWHLVPVYDLGYLLRKLPRRFTIAFDLFDDKTVIDVYYGQDDQDGIHKIEADTPENCAAKLAIALFEQGILKRKGEK